ncbi:cysteine desulfurase family protein [Devosia sp. Leaf420]|uniref:cysteine desulfurase family protein n=1 Tax=Devosia sp. Leaf420 TaxID=1736374 RepID=UPI000AA15CB4|nr:cysteine desulfurase family protein [Devosia sp. Leaf420]
MLVYLDHQASTPMSQAALNAMMPYLHASQGNPHSDDHAAGWEAARAIELARGDIARAIGADAHEIVFTSGATEANNIAVLGFVAGRSTKARILVSAIEHKSVLASARAAERAGHEVVVLPVGRDGTLDLDLLQIELTRPTDLVSVGAANNEIGTVQNISEIARIVRKNGALLHTDATQALAFNGVDVDAWGADFVSFSSHKMGGPKGIGALYVSTGARPHLTSLHFGGEQEDGLRPGTVPTFLTVGFAAACRDLPDVSRVAKWREVTNALLNGLKNLGTGVTLNGSSTERHPGNLSVVFDGVEADRLLALLQPRLAASRGSACSSGMPEPSHVLAAIGMSPAAMSSTVRFSTAPQTTYADVEHALVLLRNSLPRTKDN